MGKFDNLDKLQIQAELRRIELVPQKFWGSDVQELRDRLAKILEDERQAEIDRDERKHGEVIAAARRSRIASVLSGYPRLGTFAQTIPSAHVRSACGAHASCVNEFFGPMINLPAVAPSIFVNVKPPVLHGGNRRWRQTDFVFYPPTVIGELELRTIHAVELPQHPDEIGLSAKQFPDDNSRALAQRRPAQIFTGQHALAFHKFLVKFR